MTLTLEAVQGIRFRLAKRNGYEPDNVDDFVDAVEETFIQLLDENASLKQQLDAKAAETRSIFTPDATGDEATRAELESRQRDLAAAQQELESLRERIAKQEEEMVELQKQLSLRDEELVPLRAEVQTLRQGSAAAAMVEPPEVPTGRVENIVVTTSQQASPAVTRLLQMATEQSERLVGESQVEAQKLVADARTEGEKVIDNANRKAHETLTDARTRADRIESEARVNAENVVREAQNRADAVTVEADQRRALLFSELESQSDKLKAKVARLRTFESSYRANIESHLESQLDAVKNDAFEPQDVPELLADGVVASSATPHLDALLGEQPD